MIKDTDINPEREFVNFSSTQHSKTWAKKNRLRDSGYSSVQLIMLSRYKVHEQVNVKYSIKK